MVRLIAISASRFDRLNSRAVATSCRSRSGYRSVNFTSREARKWLPKPSGAPIRTVPVSWAREPPTASWLATMVDSIASALSATRWPASVRR